PFTGGAVRLGLGWQVLVAARWASIQYGPSTPTPRPLPQAGGEMVNGLPRAWWQCDRDANDDPRSPAASRTGGTAAGSTATTQAWLRPRPSNCPPPSCPPGRHKAR